MLGISNSCLHAKGRFFPGVLIFFALLDREQLSEPAGFRNDLFPDRDV